MKKIKSVILAAASILFALHGVAQDKNEKQKGFDPTNLFTGGSVSFSLSGGYYHYFLAGLHPHFGYTISKWIDVAGVVNFEYQSQNDGYNNKYRNTTYGIGAFTRIYPVRFLFIQAEPEYNFITQKYIPASGASQKATVNATSLLLGGGFTTSRSGKNTFTYLSVLVDVAKNINSPYVDGYGNMVPIIRAGINIGLNGNRRRRIR